MTGQTDHPSIMVAVAYVTAAWENAGPQPAYHRREQIRLHEEWPVLAEAIEQLVAAVRCPHRLD